MPSRRPLSSRQHLPDRGCGAGCRRDNRQGGGASPAEILVREIEQHLIVRIGMDGRHPSFPDAEALVQDLGERREAVGGARGVRDDVVIGRVVLVGVDAQHDRDVRSLGRRRDDHLLRAGRQMLCGGLAIGEEARRFEHDIDAEVFPGKLSRILDGQHLELVTVHRDARFARLDCGVQVAQHGVVLEQVGQRGGAGQVVDGDEIDIVVAERGPHDVAADAAKSVDANPDCHSLLRRTLHSNERLAEGQTTDLYCLSTADCRVDLPESDLTDANRGASTWRLPLANHSQRADEIGHFHGLCTGSIAL